MPSFTVQANGKVIINGSADFDGEPLNLVDDARIHAGTGFRINGNPVLPVRRDAAGNPLEGTQGNPLIIDYGITVAPGYTVARANGTHYDGVLPPKVVPPQTITVPLHATLVSDVLDQVPDNHTSIVLNQGSLKTAADWRRYIPPELSGQNQTPSSDIRVGGTAAQPVVVRVNQGDLVIPAGVDLQHLVLIVESGDIRFQGKNHDLNEVVLIANRGSITLSDVRGEALDVLASDSITVKNKVRLSGESLLASGSRRDSLKLTDVTTNTETDQLKVIAQGDIIYGGTSQIRGQLLSGNDITLSGHSTLYGSLQAKGDITFNGRSSIIGVPSLGMPPDTSPPTLDVALSNDTGSSPSDTLTNDPSISGNVQDDRRLVSLKAGFAPTPVAQFIEIFPSVGVDGAFSLAPEQLASLYGGPLPDGLHTLFLQATDATGNTSALQSVSFVLDTTAPAAPNFTLAPEFDTAPLGDHKTERDIVTLEGQSEPGSIVRLQETDAVTTANTAGRFTFEAINLAVGDNPFTVIAVDAAGNQRIFEQILTRELPNNPDVVIDWNAVLLDTIRRDQTPPPLAARNMAMVHAAIYDAVNAIEQDYAVYQVDVAAPTGASAAAAAAAAAHQVLVNLYPLQKTALDHQLAVSLAEIADGTAENDGVAVGQQVAAAILDWRRQDGHDTVMAYTPTLEPGHWQPTPANYYGALYPQWPAVTPFVMTAGHQFRPAGPPELTSAEYITEFNQVKALGAKNSTVRTGEQTEIARFWADGTGTYTPPGHWNQITEQAAIDRGYSLAENARLFALLNIGLADAGIAAWDAKYTYDFWRPVTAIRQADEDGNPSTIADPTWTPLIVTPPFPEYVSGHSTFSGTAASILTSFFGQDYSFTSTSVGLPGVSRNFTNFSAAAQEAGISRIYGGIHFQSANEDGLAMGYSIGDYVVGNFLLPRFPSPQLQINLANDTAPLGTTNRDGLTSDPTITGVVTGGSGISRLVARFDPSRPFGDITPTLVNGQFRLDSDQLASLNGAPLTDGAYTLEIQGINAIGTALANTSIRFTLDTGSPTLSLKTPISGGDHSPTVRWIGTITDPGGVATTGRYVIDNQPAVSLNVVEGGFNQLLQSDLTAGAHHSVIEVFDQAGNVTTQRVDFTVGERIQVAATGTQGWGIWTADQLTLGEQDSLLVQTTLEIELGQSAGSRKLQFDLAAQWDNQDTTSASRDRLLVYLVDPQNPSQTLLDGGEPGTALFALTGTTAEFTPGLVRYDGTTVEIDLTSLGNLSQGRLVFQMVNTDQDVNSVVQVGQLRNTVNPEGVASPIFPISYQRATPGPAVSLDRYHLVNTVDVQLSRVRLDPTTGHYQADLQVRNTGTTALSRQMLVLFPDLPQGVTLVDASGTHPAGAAYLNLRAAMPAGDLAPGATSLPIAIRLDNPQLRQFTLQAVVLTGPRDQPPQLADLGNLAVIAGGRLEIPLVATDPEGDPVTLTLKAQGPLPSGRLTGANTLVFTPSPEQVGTYSFILVATSGSLQTSQDVTLTVNPDPITTTRISGQIQNTNQAPLAGVLVEVDGYQTLTDANGHFTVELSGLPPNNTLKVFGNLIDGAAAGTDPGTVTYPFIAEKLPLVLEHEVYAGVNNVISRPIYLPELDTANAVSIDPTQSITVTTTAIPGAAVTVAAGTLKDQKGELYTGKLSITEVPTNLTPAALPANLAPDLVITIQPGEMVFVQPAPLSLPNLAGYAPGLQMDLWSINPITGEFDKVGIGEVSADGRVINTVEGGIRNSSWHFFAPFAQPLVDPASNPFNLDPRCHESQATVPATSTVELHSGALVETHDLVSYQSLGMTRGLTLTYDSLRADARPILHFGYDNLNPAAITNAPERLKLVTELTIHQKDFDYQVPGFTGGQFGLDGGENVWAIPASGGGVDAAMQADLRSLPSGQYDYSLQAGVRLFVRDEFLGSSTTNQGTLIHVNSLNSPFGSGWGLAGLQELVENKDGSILFIDGDGSELVFRATATGYDAPPGDFSTLVRLADGTFQRTMKDQTVYRFNSGNQLSLIRDPNGNETQYLYNTAQHLSQIVDPVGLITQFSYTGDRVSAITDSTGRITQLEYDAAGNLIRITDPDSSQRTWGYDADHRMISEVDQRGNREEAFYDFAGRVTKAIRKDGSVVQIASVQTQGLSRPEATSNPLTTTTSTNLGLPISTYIDGNGNVIRTQLDQAGQSVLAVDGAGLLPSVRRNEENLITQNIDGKGNITWFTYDDKGNVQSVRDQQSEIGDALIFDGIDDYVTLNATDLIANSPNSTVEAWVKFDRLSGTQTIYSEAGENGPRYKLEQVDGNLRFGIWRSDVPGNWQYVSAPVLGDLLANIATTPATADLVVSNVSAPTNASWGQNITVDWTVTNQGSYIANQDWYDSIYLSSDPFFDINDTFLSRNYVSAQTPLAPGASYSLSQSVSLPNDPNKPYVLVVTDRFYNDDRFGGNNQQVESNEANNIKVAAVVGVPDLVISNVSAPTNASWGQNMTVNWTVTNQGSYIANQDWYDSIYLSSDPFFDINDTFLSRNYVSAQTPLAPGASYSLSQSVSLPNDPNKPYVLVVTDRFYNDDRFGGNNQQVESNEANNIKVAAVVGVPDLVISNVSAPTNASWGQNMTVNWTVTNQGSYIANQDWYDSIYLSSDPFFDINDTFLSRNYVSAQTPLAPGASYSLSQSVSLPNDPNKPYVLVVTDRFYNDDRFGGNNQQVESNEANNIKVAAVVGVPDLVISNVSAPTNASWGQNMTVNWTVTNQGSYIANQDWYDSIYLSSDPFFDINDTFLSRNYVSAQTPLAPGASYSLSQSVSLPNDPSKPYVLVVTDRFYNDDRFGGNNQQVESNEANNIKVAAVVGSIAPGSSSLSDLVVTSLSAPEDATWGQTIPISWTVTNQGVETATQAWSDYVYVSADEVFDITDTLVTLVARGSQTPLGIGASYTINQNVTIPLAATGKPYLLVFTDRDRQQAEMDDTNNIGTLEFLGDPDLTVTAATIPTDTSWGQTVPISWTVTNQGEHLARSDWHDYVYASTDNTLDASDILISQAPIISQTPLAPGSSYTINQTVTIPSSTLGKPYLLFVTNRDREQRETDSSNNVKAVQTISPPDLVVADITTTQNGTWGEPIAVSWTVVNQGAATAPGDWFDYLYVSADAVLDASDTVLGRFAVNSQTPLAPGASYTLNQTVTVPLSTTGKPFILVATDRDRQQVETNEANNTKAIATLDAPDLAVTNLTAPESATWGTPIPVSWTVTNQSQYKALGNWTDYLYASSDAILDPTDILVASTPVNNAAPLAPGASYTLNQTVTVPLTATGKPYLLLATDRDRQQVETHEANNIKALATLGAPDLVVTEIDAPPPPTWGSLIPLSWSVTNQGTHTAAVTRWTDYVYASSDTVLDASDIIVGQTVISPTTPLEPGQSYNAAATISLPTTAANKPYLLVVANADKGQIESNFSNNSLTPDQETSWIHVAAVLDQSAGLELYLNGQRQAVNPLATRPTDAPISTASLSAPSTALQGQLDDVRLWNTARPRAELQANLRLVGNEAGLIGYWPLDEGQGDTAFDQTPGAHHGTLVNGPNWAGEAAPLGRVLGNNLAGQQLVYREDFENGVGAEWSARAVDATHLNSFTRFSGRWSNSSQTLTLPTQTGVNYTLAFDFYALDSWEGSNTTNGPDYFDVSVNGQLAFHETFSNISGFPQSFRSPDQGGASINLGFASFGDAIYRQIPITFTATGATTQIRFAANGLQGLADESWGIDNVRVTQAAIEPSSQLGQQHYTYDPVFNQLTSMTDELGRQTLYEIDPTTGNRLSMTQVVGDVGGTDDVVTRYTYTAQGRVDLVTDPLGRIMNYDYDSLGRLIRLTLAQGRPEQAQQHFSYDAAGNLISEINENGSRTEFRYDSLNRLTQVIESDPDGAGPLTSPVTSFSYDAAGNLIQATDPRNHPTQYAYDPLNRLARAIDALGEETTYRYDPAGNLASVTDALGHRTQYRYDARNRLSETSDPVGSRTTYRYDMADNLTAVIDPLGNRTSYAYDARNRLIRETDALGQRTSYRYNPVDQLVAQTDRNGHQTRYEYDDLDRLSQMIDPLGGVMRYTYDKVGNQLSSSDQLGRLTRYTYDNRNRLSQVIDPLEGRVSYQYDGVGNLLALTDQLNRTTRYTYDPLERLTQVSDPLQQTTRYGYDPTGNLISLTDALNRTTSYQYDALNRRTTTINPLGDTATTDYDAVGNLTATTDELGRTTRLSYDARNWLTGITDPLGQTTVTQYDAMGNVVALTDALQQQTRYTYDMLYRVQQETDALGKATTYTYDPEGNLLSLTDSVNNTTTYAYDALDRRVSDTNTLGHRRSYRYDAVGNQVGMTDRNGRRLSYSYDALDRQTTEQWLDGAGQPIYGLSYTYDAASQLTTATDPTARYGYTYDLAGRLTRTDNAGTAGVPNVVFDYEYDAVNNLRFVRDRINGQAAGIEEFSYDALNRTTRITQSGNGVSQKRVDMGYDKASQMTSLSRFGDLAGSQSVAESEFTYDLGGRLTNLSHSHLETVLAAYGLTYDAANRITRISSVDGINDYTYDQRDQLLGADYDYQGDEVYSYDENGNRTNPGYVTGVNNQLLSDGVYTYEYDQEGNRTRRTNIATGEVTQYGWDYRNRLVGVVTKNSSGTITQQVTYTYDFENRRISKAVDSDRDGAAPAEVERFVYDGDHIALVFDGQGNQIHRYLHGPQIDQVLAQEDAQGNTLWALSDHQGTVRDVVDEAGIPVNHITYDSFGNATNQTNPTVYFRFGYTGREPDAETGLTYYRARYVDPRTGGFIGEDPIGFRAGDTNLYRYVGNSPTNFTDPSGLQLSENPLSDLAGQVVSTWFMAGVAAWTAIGNSITTGNQGIGGSNNINFPGTVPPLKIPNHTGHGPIDRGAAGEALEGICRILRIPLPQVPGFPENPAEGLVPPFLESNTINPDKQGRHIPGHRRFIPGRSELTHPNPQSLIDQFAGKGQAANKIPIGQPGSNERVDFGETIGNFVDQDTGIKIPTTIGTIRYSKKDVHIVPARPKSNELE
ncbi:CARDB domain-containing protein [Synechococcus sp. PCC 6312]|uniref:CARDB domain-containing protein n=1 Tax=Synechococcus sp. (strain ATCC 27167 / PCC 6312) TaxID=195253 RepID=UPI0012EA45B5|nr:CARDB domain-containing protein [Synechococcus sp. PCC 6312]